MSDLFQTQSERKHVEKSNVSSDVAGSSSDHSLSAQDLNSKFQKWRSWWSKKTHNGCIASPESSDSDHECLYDFENSIIMKARCRLMRIVGKLNDVFTGVQDVHLERYGPSEVEDSSRNIKLRMRDRFPGLGTQQWELMLLMNSVDMMYRKVQAIRSLCTSYRARMGMQVQRRINEDSRCIIETRVEKMDSNNDLDSTKTRVEDKTAARNPLVRGFTCILALICSAFYFIIGKSFLKTTKTAPPSKTQSTSDDLASGLIKVAFNRRRDDKGMKDSATTDSWMLLTVTSYPRDGIVMRCVNLETFLSRDIPNIQVKRITSATSAKTKNTLTPALKTRYRQTIEYFGEIGSCAYIHRLLKGINADLFEVQKGLDGIHDRPFKHSKPYSDRQGLLRQALTRGEVRLELKQIANTSTSRRELLTKDELIKVVLLLEARTEGIHMRYDSWRREREIPGRRHKNVKKSVVKKEVRVETKMCFRQTSGGLVVRRICMAKKRSLVDRAFGGPTMNGLNVAPFLNT